MSVYEGRDASLMSPVIMRPGARIRQAEREIAGHISAVLEKLSSEIDMFPSSVEVELLDVSTYDKPGVSVVSSVKLRY